MAQTTAITVDKHLNDVVIRHFHNRRDAAKTLLVYFLVVYRIDVHHVAVRAGFEVSLVVVSAEQTVIVLRQSLRQVYNFLLSFSVRHRYLIVVALREDGV